MSETQAKFLTGSLTRHIVTMSVTSAFGLLALFVVDLVDMIFISMLGVEELAAAVGFAGTILFMTTSISIGMGIAGGALIARALGEGKADRARELLTHVVVFGVICAVIVATAMFYNLDGLTGLIGATGETQALVISYLRILIPTMPILLIGIVTSAALRGHGAARLAMMVTLVAGIVNAVLDPIFIFTFDMGLEGAAWASVVSRFAMSTTAVWVLVRRYDGFSRLVPRAFLRDLKPITAIAFPAMLTNVATPVGAAFVTRAAAEFGGPAVAGMAIIGRLTPIAFALIFAMSGAIGPIIGQNFGAGQHARVREAYNRSLMLIVLYVVPVIGVMYLLRAPIADLFDAQGRTRDLVYLFCGPLSLAWVFNGVIFVGNAAYNNLGHPYYSTWINWARNTLGIMPFVYVGARVWGAEGVLIGQMAGGVVVAIVSYVLAQRLMHHAETDQIVNPIEPAFGGNRRSFVILNHRR
ncbi:MAG: MATE family efflux transporter [Aliishimia sp.]